MSQWLKTILAAAFSGMTTMACAQTPAPQPAAGPAPPTEPENVRVQVETERRQEETARRQQESARRQGEAAMRAAEAAQRSSRSLTFAMAGGKKEKVAFIGLVTTPVTAALREN